MTSNIEVEVDWTKTGTWVDESDLVRPNMAPVQASYGRDQITALAPTVAGTGSFTLDNRTRRFSPRAATLADGSANPLYGYLKPARPVRITRTVTGTPEQIIRTNKASNPKLGTNDTYWGSFAGTGGAGTRSRETAGGPAVAPAFSRFTWTTGTSAVDGGLWYSVADDPGMVCLPGEKVSLFAYARCSKTQRVQLYVFYQNAASTTLLATGLVWILSAGSWIPLKFDQASVAPANTTKIRVGLFSEVGTSGTVWNVADTLDLTAVCAVNGPTAPLAYFDGSTTATSQYAYRWTGTADASTSQEYVAAVDDTTYSLFTGHTDDGPVNPDYDSKSVSVSLVDNLADFRGHTITTPLYRGLRTGEAVGYVLDACGWPEDLRDLDPGATVCPWWWEDGTDALTALEKLVRSEGPPALLTMGADGEVIFRDRHHRLLDETSLTSQQTWRSSGYGLVMNKGFSYDESWKNIVNTGTASVDVRTPQDSQVVWTSEGTIALSSGEERLVTASASDPFYDAIPPVAGTDFVQVSGTVTTTLFRASGASATIKLLASGGAAVIADLQLRASPLTVAYTVQVSASDSESVEDYGPRSFPGDLPWCNQYDAEAVLSAAVAQRSQPLPVIQARFMVGTDPTKLPLLARDLSERVTVVEDETVTDGDFYIESISHTLTGFLDHEVTFGLEAAPAAIDPVFMFGDASAGFGFGKFGNGIDNPDKAFVFAGGASRGFGAGRFGR